MLQSIASAGPVIYPLIFCSIAVLALILEKSIRLLLYPRLEVEQSIKQFTHNINGDKKIGDKKIEINQGMGNGVVRQHGLAAALRQLYQLRSMKKAQREEHLQLWIIEEKKYLLTGNQCLQLLGVVAPLLGLLGTVLGIITMFHDVAARQGPVTPALLASGMWQAMGTTAMGLIVAIPAIALGQGFLLWGNYLIEKIEFAVNRCNLLLDGVGFVVQEQLAAEKDNLGEVA